jgi:hypothetical protein
VAIVIHIPLFRMIINFIIFYIGYCIFGYSLYFYIHKHGDRLSEQTTIMNTFYGKPLNQLTQGELTLLSLDIDISNIIKSQNRTILPSVLRLRGDVLSKCFDNGGDYCLDTFLEENGLVMNMELPTNSRLGNLQLN